MGKHHSNAHDQEEHSMSNHRYKDRPRLKSCKMFSSRAAWTISTMILVVLITTRSLSKSSADKEILLDRPAACYVQRMLDRVAAPPGTSHKEVMYDCFLRDVERGRLVENPQIPLHRSIGSRYAQGGKLQGGKLRVVSFNVHFFRSGYSEVELGDSFEEVLGVIGDLNPDICLLQEVCTGGVHGRWPTLVGRGGGRPRAATSGN